MNSRPTSLIVVIAMLSVLLLPFHQAGAQTEPEKRPGPVPQTTPVPPPPAQPTAGPAGAPATLDDAALAAQIDSTMLWMQSVVADARSLSKSFASLAALHHGADRSEILMMQRMSEAMAGMGDEVIKTLGQYKTMLEDETASDTGMMKAEVQQLKAAIVVIAGEVADAVQTLHRLQGQLGQG